MFYQGVSGVTEFIAPFLTWNRPSTLPTRTSLRHTIINTCVIHLSSDDRDSVMLEGPAEN